MITLTKDKISKYLHNSELYDLIESNDQFNIPLEFYKELLLIETNNDLIYYCNILNYWGVRYIPIDLYKYVFNNKKTIDITQLSNPLVKLINMIIYDIEYVNIDEFNNIFLIFKYNFNQSVNKHFYPEGITHLVFGRDFNQVVNDLPDTITHLTFGWDFNQSVDNLPKSITHLTFGSHFNQLVNNLPSSITHLTFSNNFNQLVNNLPNNIIYLYFGNSFNKSVDNLPKHITHLTFGWNFNQPVNNLPNSITHLTFWWSYKQNLNNLPKSIINIDYKSIYNY